MPEPALDLAAFAERVLRRPLWPHQLAAARSPAFITTIAKARRTGGTVLAEAMAMHTAFAHRGCRVLVLSATQDAARRVTESIGATLGANPVTRGSVVDDFATRVRLTNGSEIVSLPASQRQVRGYGEGVLLVILDEAGFMPEELWAAASYTALDERARGSRILMLGTPWGGPDAFFRRAFERGRSGDPDHSAHHWTFEANPALDRAYLERQRERVSPQEYAAEVLGEWSEAIGSLFPRELLERQTADLELPAIGNLAGPARAGIGLDWGVSFDRSAAALFYRLPVAALNPDRELRPAFVLVPHVWPAKHPLSAVVREVGELSAPLSHVASETSGVGAMPTQELLSALKRRGERILFTAVATTNQKKTAGYGCLLGLLEQGQLVLPRHPDLLRQLAGLRFEQGERGFTRIEPESPAIHDDVTDSAMVGTRPRTDRGGAIVCGLAIDARPARAFPDAAVPELEEAIVTTGGGLRLYRRPPLQSVAGAELTLPAGVAVADSTGPPSSPRIRALREVLRAAMENPDEEEA